MSIAVLMQQLRDAGAPIEAIMIAVAAGEAVEAKHLAAEEARKADQRERTQLYRSRGGGRIPDDMRAFVLERDEYACVYCGGQFVPLSCDHVVPVSRGGETTADNLAAACRPCNSSKRDRLLSEWVGQCR